MTETNDPSQIYLDGMPIWVQQAFRMIREREDWTVNHDDALSLLFEKMMTMENAQDIIGKGFANTSPDDQALIIQTLAYLRIEQAMYFLTEMPIEHKAEFIKIITSLGDETEAERINMLSRLETLSRLGMLNQIFSPERVNLVAAILETYPDEDV